MRVGTYPDQDLSSARAEIETCIKQAAHKDAFLRNMAPEITWNGFQAEGYVLKGAEEPLKVLDGAHRSVFGQALTSVAIFLCVVCSTFWLADQRVAELGAIDSALLADELPIGAFTDKGNTKTLVTGAPVRHTGRTLLDRRLLTGRDLSRAIILMAVLGRCRALNPHAPSELD